MCIAIKNILYCGCNELTEIPTPRFPRLKELWCINCPRLTKIPIIPALKKNSVFKLSIINRNSCYTYPSWVPWIKITKMDQEQFQVLFIPKMD